MSDDWQRFIFAIMAAMAVIFIIWKIIEVLQ